MAVETLGQAMDLSWGVEMRCAFGPDRGMVRGRECHYSHRLDLPTLVCTRGRDFPMARLAQRLRCPQCGSREVRVLFHAPAGADRTRASARG